MKSDRSSNFRWLTSLVLLGCLLGVATVAATTYVSPAASATPLACVDNQHANVQGYSTGYHYGNGADIYVNSGGVISGLHDAIYRSIFVYYDSTDFVEVGWGAGPNTITGQSNPTAYAYWDNNGATGHKKWNSLSESTDYAFAIENTGHVGIFGFFLNASKFAASTTMTFNAGYPLSNSERYDSCDSLWTHEYLLSYLKSDNSWSTNWGNWICWNNTSNNYYLHKNSYSDLTVTQTSSGSIC